ncbi:hypothetical protein GCM10010276_00100 [Streptomyces longisporus]|uniref:Uncharacterized protein n=1 Tax=Streptomyces longisporus TaxID=1948 RepID=A0ABP5Y2F9_STRLO
MANPLEVAAPIQARTVVTHSGPLYETIGNRVGGNPHDGLTVRGGAVRKILPTCSRSTYGWLNRP